MTRTMKDGEVVVVVHHINRTRGFGIIDRSIDSIDSIRSVDRFDRFHSIDSIDSIDR